jgi:hypothetical protein
MKSIACGWGIATAALAHARVGKAVAMTNHRIDPVNRFLSFFSGVILRKM